MSSPHIIPTAINMPRTSLTKASPKTKSLRTTVPNSVVSQFGLTSADKLDWFLVAESQGKLGIKVIPIKEVEQNEKETSSSL